MRQGLGKPIFLVEKCEGLWYNANAFYGIICACAQFVPALVVALAFIVSAQSNLLCERSEAELGSQAKREHRGAGSPVASEGIFAKGEIPARGCHKRSAITFADRFFYDFCYF